MPGLDKNPVPAVIVDCPVPTDNHAPPASLRSHCKLQLHVPLVVAVISTASPRQTSVLSAKRLTVGLSVTTVIGVGSVRSGVAGLSDRAKSPYLAPR